MRVKSGTITKSRHQEVLKSVRGHRLARSKHYKIAHEESLHAGQYAYVGRRLKKRDFRRLWIQRINAGLSQIDQGPSYSVFTHLLKDQKVGINRKMLAELATNQPETFQALVSQVYGK